MNLIPTLVRERRLLLPCAMSIALHVLAFGLLAPSTERVVSTDAAPRIAVTLLPAAPASPPAPVANPVQALQQPLPRIAERRAAAPAVAPKPPSTTQPAAEQDASVAPVAGAGWNPQAAGQGDAPTQMPGRYQVQLPPSALLSFDVTRSSAGQATVPAGAALIDWRNAADG